MQQSLCFCNWHMHFSHWGGPCITKWMCPCSVCIEITSTKTLQIVYFRFVRRASGLVCIKVRSISTFCVVGNKMAEFNDWMASCGTNIASKSDPKTKSDTIQSNKIHRHNHFGDSFQLSFGLAPDSWRTIFNCCVFPNQLSTHWAYRWAYSGQQSVPIAQN